VNCAFCRLAIATPEQGVVLAALGKPLCTVHKEPCAQQIKLGAQLVGLAAVKGLHSYLVARAPALVQAIERVQQLKA